jgi:hypothetical protein
MSLWARRASIGTFRPVPEGMFPETRLPERGPLGNSPQLAIAPSYTSRTSGTGESRRVLHGARYSYADGYELQLTGAEGEPPAPRKSRSHKGPRPSPRRYAVDSSQQSTSMSSYSVHRSIPPTQGTVPTSLLYPEISQLKTEKLEHR